MRLSVMIKTAVSSVLILLLAASIHSKLLAIRSASSSSSVKARTTTPFADNFLEKYFVLDLVRLCKEIYDVDKIYENPADAISNPKFQLLQFIRAEFSTEVMILSSEEEPYVSKPIVVFRGTEDFQDALADGKLRREKSKFVNAPDEVYIHRGFQDAVFEDNVLGQVEKKVLELIGEDGEVIVSGHSLGGATAHITAVYFADKYPNMTVTMFNIGAPRIGNEEFKIWSEGLENLASWRYVFRRDTVPRLIPNSLGYHHAGHLFQVYKSRSQYYSEVFYRQVGNDEDYAGAPYWWYFGSSVTQHFPRNYLKEFELNEDTDAFWPTTFMEKSLWYHIKNMMYLPVEIFTAYIDQRNE